MRQLDLRAQELQPLEVLIDRARADGAAAGQRDAGAAETGHERPQHQDAGAHRLHHLVRGFRIGDVLRVDLHGRSVAFDARSHVAEQPAQRADVGEIRHAAEDGPAFCEQRSGDLRQRGVLRAGHLHFTGQRLAPGDLDRVHLCPFPYDVAVEPREVTLDAQLRQPRLAQQDHHRLSLRDRP